jgi:hypothetical protein
MRYEVKRRLAMTGRSERSRNFRRTLLEMGFIIFLFYSNLLMGQYNLGHNFGDRPILVAITNIFTLDNFIIALLSAFVGHVVFDYIRKRL